MRGSSAGGISRHVVKLVGHNLLCTATVIGRQQLLTANHCVEGTGPFFVIAGGKRIAVASHAPPGRPRCSRWRAPCPRSIVPIETGAAGGDGTYTIAGYGTAQESARMRSAGLREARLVTDSRYNALVDPRRRGPISASACMGDLRRPGREVRRQALRAGRHRGARLELRRHRRLRFPHAFLLGQRREQRRLRAGRHDAPGVRAAHAARRRQEAPPPVGGALDTHFVKGHAEERRGKPRRSFFAHDRASQRTYRER